jgi:RimJ/RimL family protein N-acetyltransferase
VRIQDSLRRLASLAIAALTDVANERSRRLMERMGMEHERRAVVAGLDTVYHTRRGDPAR